MKKGETKKIRSGKGRKGKDKDDEGEVKKTKK